MDKCLYIYVTVHQLILLYIYWDNDLLLRTAYTVHVQIGRDRSLRADADAVLPYMHSDLDLTPKPIKKAGKSSRERSRSLPRKIATVSVS